MLQWYHVKNSSARCMALGSIGAKEGDPIYNITAKVWRFDDGSWGYACNSTMWESKEDADDYEKSGRFDELTEKLKHTFAELYQWKMTLEKEGVRQAVTSEDLAVKYYSIVTGKSFQ